MRHYDTVMPWVGLFLFDYPIIGSICRYYNGLPVTQISRYCFRNPLVASDHS